MTVYFITELSDDAVDPLRIKIGRSVNVKRRMSNLQTGNPDELALMGEIRTQGITQDAVVERTLHKRYASKHLTREWFSLGASDVIDALKYHSSMAYITVGSDPFEIVSYDRDAIPEFASPWAWGDVEVWDFCPCCGWAGGWSYNESYCGERCLNCGAGEVDFDQSHLYEKY
ncbi:GIY-YIG nuclease family protein [Flexibacterium corallicola]|uniref:GIY-YIG nuclease family protein n=1 Tax=Flexibacterium corallicola TaxID=3037259 RepID=UPI00286F3057|nr:GIY-YIG nuclease family protein [Pseudovibrio sp. M1P-2-3]